MGKKKASTHLPPPKKAKTVRGGVSLARPRLSGAALEERKEEQRRIQREKDDQRKEFNGLLREMLDFVQPHMGKKAAKQWSDAKYRALGGNLEREGKHSKNDLQNRSDALKRKTERLRQQKEQLGVDVSGLQVKSIQQVERDKKKQLTERRQREQVARESRMMVGSGSTLRGGREKKGMLMLDKKLLSKYGVK